MNPLLLLILLSLADQKKVRNGRKYSLPPYFDTLNTEILQDKLQSAVNALDKVNRLNQIVREPKALTATADGDSGLPAPLNQMDQIAPLMQLAQGIDIKSLIQNIGPIMNMLSNSQEK